VKWDFLSVAIIVLGAYLYVRLLQAEEKKEVKLNDFQIRAQKYVKSGQFAKAEEEILKDLKRNNPSNFAHNYYALGIIYYNQKKHKEALHALKKAWLADRENYDAIFLIGRIYHDMYQDVANPDFLEKSVYYFERTLEVNPCHIQALFGLGAVHFDWQNIDKAAECYRRILDAFPENANATYNFGACCLGRENYEMAISYYKKALVLNVDDQQFAEYHIGYCYQCLEDFERAKKWYTFSLENGCKSAKEKLNELKARKTAGN